MSKCIFPLAVVIAVVVAGQDASAGIFGRMGGCPNGQCSMRTYHPVGQVTQAPPAPTQKAEAKPAPAQKATQKAAAQQPATEAPVAETQVTPAVVETETAPTTRMATSRGRMLRRWSR